MLSTLKKEEKRTFMKRKTILDNGRIAIKRWFLIQTVTFMGKNPGNRVAHKRLAGKCQLEKNGLLGDFFLRNIC